MREAIDLSANRLSAGPNRPYSHPVTLPEVVLKYEQKDITADIRPYLTTVSYTDYLGGQSDELQIELEDGDGRWLRTWYPEQGDSLSLEIGDQFTGMVKMGSFELAEIEYRHPPSTVRLKALATGITRSNRTLKPKVYRDTTLAGIVREVARRLKLSVSGTVADIPVGHITQYQERDVEFLARLAREYGHTFKIVNRTLVFQNNIELAAQTPVRILLPEEITAVRLRDLIKGVPDEAVVSGYDARSKQVRRQSRRNTPLRQGGRRGSASDTLKIVANRGESDGQLAARADAALNDAKHSQVAGSITLAGHAKLVAGQVVGLQGFGKLSGHYLVKQSSHDIRRTAGYVTALEVRMVAYVPDETAADGKRETDDAAGT